jgi:hypothetical protein
MLMLMPHSFVVSEENIQEGRDVMNDMARIHAFSGAPSTFSYMLNIKQTLSREWQSVVQK